MNLKFLRASSITTYSGCQFQYFMENSLGLPSKSGKKAKLGTIIHHVLEIMARAKKNNHLSGVFIDHEKLLEICWARYMKEDEDPESFKPRDYKFCKTSIEKILPTQYNPLNLNVLATEKRFQIPLSDYGLSYEYYDIIKKVKESGIFEIRGTIDLVTEINSDTLEIIDWKTGSRKCWNTGVLKDYDYLKSKDIQLRMYDLATSIVYPQYKNRIMTIHFVNDGGPYSVSFDDEDRKKTLDILKNNIDEISNNWLPTRLKEEKPRDAKWKCKNVCHFGKTKGSNGCSVCDNIYYYMVQNGLDATIEKVEEIKSSKVVAEDKSTSNRRNIY